MMSSGNSIDTGRMKSETGLQARHFYLLLAMIAATVAVVMSPHTHPAALILLSAAILSAGFAGAALHHALLGFFTGHGPAGAQLSTTGRAALEQDKSIVLRSIKELEFDRAMGKVSEADFTEIAARLRARAMAIMEDLDRAPIEAPRPRSSKGESAARPSPSLAGQQRCNSCERTVDPQANFCPHCGTRL
jgi:hypothetical protein